MTRYSDTELTLFNRYTNLLRDVVLRDQGTFDGIMLNAAKCTACARECPAGIPRQLRDSEWVRCPACVKAKVLVPSLTRELHGTDGARAIKDATQELTSEVAAALAKAKQRKDAQQPPSRELRLNKLARSINNLRQSLKDCKDDKERIARERVIAAATAGYLRMSGGVPPPEPEAKSPDEVTP